MSLNIFWILNAVLTKIQMTGSTLVLLCPPSCSGEGRTMRVICEQRSDLLSWIGDTGGILSTDSVEVLLTRFQTRHLMRTMRQ